MKPWFFEATMMDRQNRGEAMGSLKQKKKLKRTICKHTHKLTTQESISLPSEFRKLEHLPVFKEIITSIPGTRTFV